MKFFIVGCAKTGTWLITRLFYAFDGFEKIFLDDEHSLQFLLQAECLQKDAHMICKRTCSSIFSNVFTEKFNEDLKLIKEHDIKIIYIRRNKIDTMKSNNGYVSAERYDACEHQARIYSDYIDYVIDYDKLIIDPDRTQLEIASKFRLDIKYKWSDYPNFIRKSVV